MAVVKYGELCLWPGDTHHQQQEILRQEQIRRRVNATLLYAYLLGFSLIIDRNVHLD